MAPRSDAGGRFRLRSLWSGSIGNQCLLMLIAGVLVGLFLPQLTPHLRPLATLFLQVSQIVVMPFLILELIVGFGGLSSHGLRHLLSGGLVVLAGLQG